MEKKEYEPEEVASKFWWDTLLYYIIFLVFLVIGGAIVLFFAKPLFWFLEDVKLNENLKLVIVSIFEAIFYLFVIYLALKESLSKINKKAIIKKDKVPLIMESFRTKSYILLTLGIIRVMFSIMNTQNVLDRNTFWSYSTYSNIIFEQVCRNTFIKNS